MIQTRLRTTSPRALLLGAVTAAALGGWLSPAAAFPGEPMRADAPHPAATFVDDGVGPYGVNAHPGHPGHAGLYDCGPGGKRTRLSQKSCGGIDRFGHLSSD